MTDRDLEYLPYGIVQCLKCPECGRDRIRTPDVTKGKRVLKSGHWVCPVLGCGRATTDFDMHAEVLMNVPKAIAQHDPQRATYFWNYVLKRGTEAWATDEQIERARKAGSWPKARKARAK